MVRPTDHATGVGLGPDRAPAFGGRMVQHLDHTGRLGGPATIAHQPRALPKLFAGPMARRLDQRLAGRAADRSPHCLSPERSRCAEHLFQIPFIQ
jgi:hypothetical protein